jgi:hypothetical protein
LSCGHQARQFAGCAMTAATELGRAASQVESITSISGIRTACHGPVASVLATG